MTRTIVATTTAVRGSLLMMRDRIVSGLSRAVIVVEAGERSGTMDTVRQARRQGRLIFALPGSPGADAALAQGAAPLDPATADLDALSRRIQGASTEEGKPRLPASLEDLWS